MISIKELEIMNHESNHPLVKELIREIFRLRLALCDVADRLPDELYEFKEGIDIDLGGKK